jgi:phage repressor protein C with HTH and peptisase S24 domain
MNFDLRRFRKDKGLSQKDLASILGIGQSFISQIETGKDSMPEEYYNLLTEKYGELGEYLSCKQEEPSDQIPSAHLVPLLPLYAQGGPLNDFVASIRATDCEKVISPIAGADFAITITGDSMAPEYPSGSRILIKRIDEKAFIEWGRVYVLDTMNGTIVKEVRKGNSDDEVMCYSLNPDPKFQPFAVKFSNIFGFYKVMLCLSLK